MSSYIHGADVSKALVIPYPARTSIDRMTLTAQQMLANIQTVFAKCCQLAKCTVSVFLKEGKNANSERE